MHFTLFYIYVNYSIEGMTLSPKQQLFHQQYRELFRYLYTYVTYRVDNITDAEDIVSQTLVDAYEQIEQFNATKGELVQWLTGIARYKIINFWQRNKIMVALEEVEYQLLHLPQSALEQAIDEEIIFDAVMAQLSPKVQALFALRYVDNLTYEEIAAAVGQQPANIRKIFSLTHKKLQPIIKNLQLTL